jgi:acetoin utilization deacetylase AcuC-like enzyme
VQIGNSSVLVALQQQTRSHGPKKISNMTTLLITHDAFAHHAVPEGHPERPDRIRAVQTALSTARFDALRREPALLADLSLARLVHDEAYIQRFEALQPAEGFMGIDADTFVSPGTMEAIRRAIGGVERGVDAVCGGAAKNAFLAARPPGHHAEHDKAMGFCFVNTAAVGARIAQQKHGLERVAIIDWDVHHGNGTQDIFWSDKSVLYASTHEMPLYPGTGSPTETGEHGTIVNAALRSNDGSEAFREIFSRAILPRVEMHAPDLIIISAGFDAHKRDPLANLRLEAADFAWATEQLMDIAEKRCKGRVVSVLEGGYDLVGLATSTAAHIEALMGA